MNQTKLLLTSITIAGLTLTGCVPQHPQEIPKLTPQVRTQRLNNIQEWHIAGKVGIRDGNQGHNVSMEWQQNHDKYRLRFYSPFSTESVVVSGKPGDVTLITADGKQYTSPNPEQLLFEHVGWNIPFAGLRYWIKGQAAPYSTPTKIKLDKYNQLQTLDQDGWHIDYQSYVVRDSITLPEKLTMTNQQFKLKIIVTHWD